MENVHQAASQTYREARTELLAAERDLRDATERVAALRRALPPGPEVSPFTPLTLASGKPTTLGGLFGRHRSLLAYHMMYDEDWAEPGAMCGMWIDGIDALVPHLSEHAAVAVLAPATPGQLAETAGRRNWRWISVVSTQPGDLTEQLGAREPEWGLEPGLTALHYDEAGALRVHWHGSAGLHHPADTVPQDYAAPDGADSRGVDPFCVTWALLDLLPGGRGDWYASRQDRP